MKGSRVLIAIALALALLLTGCPFGGGSSGGVLTEAIADCFRVKAGDIACLVDMVVILFVLYAVAGTDCSGLRASIETDSNLEALDPGLDGEVVMGVHPAGASSDGSDDTGVGASYGDGSWKPFAFGPGDSMPADGMYAATIESNTAVLELGTLADGSCIEDDAEVRIKFEMNEGPNSDRRYDTFPRDLMTYASVGDLQF